MCFGNQTETKNTTQNTTGTSNQTGTATGSTAQNVAGSSGTTTTANPAVQQAAVQNLDYVKNLQTQGFTPYTGEQVAAFSPQQSSGFNMTNNIANDPTAGISKALIGSYAGAPAQNVSANTINSAMSPYMNRYVMEALAPQLQQMELAQAGDRNRINAQATGSGAFGDARTGFEQGANTFNHLLERQGLIGNAYNSAFNTAIGAGAQDVSNNLSAQNSNASYMEQMLQRALGGSTALQGLQNQQLGVAGAQTQAGATQTAQQQADLTARYNQWLMAQQYPFQTSQLVNQTVSAGAGAMPGTTQTNTAGQTTGSNTANTNTTGATTGYTTGTSETTKPDNSGMALLGTLGGAVLGNPGLFSDIRLKEDIAEVGALADGQKIYSYRYKGDPVPRIGLMAQEVVKHRPDAVGVTKDGFMMVDYAKATEGARMLSMAL